MPNGRFPPINAFTGGGIDINRRQALIALGEVLYAVQLAEGLIKIGWTHRLDKRLYRFPGSTLLAVRAGSRDAERAVHRTLVVNRARGYEYYHRTPAVIALVNDWREPLGLPPLKH